MPRGYNNSKNTHSPHPPRERRKTEKYEMNPKTANRKKDEKKYTQMSNL